MSVIDHWGFMAEGHHWVSAIFRTIEGINLELFHWINTSGNPTTTLWSVSLFFAEYLIWIVPVFLMTCWCLSGRKNRMNLLAAATAATAGLSANYLIGLLWNHPRPFMVGAGHTLIWHTPDSSFPSDHLTLLWAIGFTLLSRHGLRRAGLAFTLLGLPVAWARIYLGVHFPLDMLGAMLVSGACCALTNRHARRYLPLFYCTVMVLYRALSASWFRRA